jgi:hypothetical protein
MEILIFCAVMLMGPMIQSMLSILMHPSKSKNQTILDALTEGRYARLHDEYAA